MWSSVGPWALSARYKCHQVLSCLAYLPCARRANVNFSRTAKSLARLEPSAPQSHVGMDSRLSVSMQKGEPEEAVLSWVVTRKHLIGVKDLGTVLRVCLQSGAISKIVNRPTLDRIELYSSAARTPVRLTGSAVRMDVRQHIVQKQNMAVWLSE